MVFHFTGSDVEIDHSLIIAASSGKSLSLYRLHFDVINSFFIICKIDIEANPFPVTGQSDRFLRLRPDNGFDLSTGDQLCQLNAQIFLLLQDPAKEKIIRKVQFIISAPRPKGAGSSRRL